MTIISLTGRLRHTETGEPFEFVVRDGDHRYNQAHYEALGEVGYYLTPEIGTTSLPYKGQIVGPIVSLVPLYSGA